MLLLIVQSVLIIIIKFFLKIDRLYVAFDFRRSTSSCIERLWTTQICTSWATVREASLNKLYFKNCLECHVNWINFQLIFNPLPVKRLNMCHICYILYLFVYMSSFFAFQHCNEMDFLSKWVDHRPPPHPNIFVYSSSYLFFYKWLCSFYRIITLFIKYFLFKMRTLLRRKQFCSDAHSICSIFIPYLICTICNNGRLTALDLTSVPLDQNARVK